MKLAQDRVDKQAVKWDPWNCKQVGKGNVKSHWQHYRV